MYYKTKKSICGGSVYTVSYQYCWRYTKALIIKEQHCSNKIYYVHISITQIHIEENSFRLQSLFYNWVQFSQSNIRAFVTFQINLYPDQFNDSISQKIVSYGTVASKYHKLQGTQILSTFFWFFIEVFQRHKWFNKNLSCFVKICLPYNVIARISVLQNQLYCAETSQK